MNIKITNYFFEDNGKKYYFTTLDEAEDFMYHLKYLEGDPYRNIYIEELTKLLPI